MSLPNATVKGQVGGGLSATVLASTENKEISKLYEGSYRRSTVHYCHAQHCTQKCVYLFEAIFLDQRSEFSSDSGKEP